MRCNAYADESGNSGLKLFGDHQDTFWTGTLISFADLDRKYFGFHRELLALAGKPELHGNELGLGRIEKIAGRLAWFIREKKLRFSFVRVHKPYLAATKLFDLAFDSGANPAVPPLAYGVRHLRLINLLHFSQLLTFEDLKEFWDLFQAKDPNRFGHLLAAIRDRVTRAPCDSRSVQVLSESLDWASRHPEAVLDPFGEGDAPNFVAFTALFDYLHQFHRQYGHTIGCFVHDEQDQFIPAFIEAFPLLAKFQGKSHPLAMISDIEPISSFDCVLEVRSSKSSFGLQVVDVCMWLTKRVLENRNELRGQCAVLWQCLLERSLVKDYDFAMLIREVEAGTKFLAGHEYSDQQLAEARKLLAKLEASRRERLLAAE